LSPENFPRPRRQSHAEDSGLPNGPLPAV
jgi:hypothetical protein